MPAAAVIPAPIAYIKVVAVKKLVVELLCMHSSGFGQAVVCTSACKLRPAFTGRLRSRPFTLKKIRVFQAGNGSNTLAWNNGIGLLSIWLVIGHE